MRFAEKAILSAALLVLVVLVSATVVVHKMTRPQRPALAVAQSEPVTLPEPTATPVPTSTPAPTATPRPTKMPGTVILQGAPGNSVVQMFDSLSDDASVVATFRNGTECQKSGRLHQVSVAGVSMSFYRINCHGTGGYVNSRWVR